MKRYLLALTLTLLGGFAHAQQELEPLDSVLVQSQRSSEYNAKLRRILFPQTEPRDHFQFFVKPALRTETLLTVRKEKNEYTAQVRRPERPVYHHEGDSQLKVTEQEKRLPAPVAQRATKLWQAMVLRARFKPFVIGVDGVSYVFLASHRDYNPTLAAETWSPAQNSKPGLLAEIGTLLISYVQAPPDAEETILKQLDENMTRLETALRTDGDK